MVSPKGKATRPTSDRVREAMMQHLEVVRLEGGFEGKTILDLFAGSGSLSLEAISRGASHATLVEAAKAAIGTIKTNMVALDCVDSVRIVRGSLPRTLRALRGTSFDVVFADPPYAMVEGFPWSLLGPFVAPGGLLVVEHACRLPPALTEAFSVLAVRTYSDTCITIATSREQPTPAARPE